MTVGVVLADTECVGCLLGTKYCGRGEGVESQVESSCQPNGERRKMRFQRGLLAGHLHWLVIGLPRAPSFGPPRIEDGLDG